MAVGAHAQIISNDFVQKGSAQLSKGDQLYNDGQTAMNNGDWSGAVDKFNQLIALKTNRTSAAMYWKAYSLNKLGRAQDALSTIGDLKRQYPTSKYANDASALELEIRGPGSVVRQADRDTRQGDRDARTQDEDLKLLALNSLMNTDEQRAVPLLEKFLQTNQSKRLRERALFVLAQSDNPQAENLIARIAKGEQYPELQMQAIHQIGVVNSSDKNMQTLSQIYATTNNYDVKRTILHTFGISGESEKLMQAARSEKDPKLQRDAIHGLGISGAQTELRQLYKELPGEDAKSSILDAFIVSGDSEGFMNVAKTETNPKLRKQAIRGIGINGGRGSGQTLVQIYQQNNDVETKKAALEALFISDNGHALVELAKSEKDPGMRRAIMDKLSVMGNKEATDYMIEILNK
jgi:outer membrane protein assembly factor BamD (BamD/ComL family)